MSDSVILTMEIVFDLLYLGTIWTLVILMFLKKKNLTEENRSIGLLFLSAFFLLALGDTGHVGFRVIAYATGGLQSNPFLVGVGALATAVTITFFYMIVVEIWRIRIGRQRNILWWFLMFTGIIRLIIMIPAQNQWGQVVPPSTWSLYRNIPLMIQGLGIGLIMHLEGIKSNDRLLKNISYMIFLSYLFYTPVILYVQKLPMLGMLMIPKTLAYVALAFMTYSLFRKPILAEPVGA